MGIPFEMSREEADEQFEQLFPTPGRKAFSESREEILEALREAIAEEPDESMTQAEFDDALGKALRLCRLAADLNLPIEEMLDHLSEAIEDLPGGLPGTELAETGQRHPQTGELEALREIIAAVGEVAAIGVGLGGQEGAKPAGRSAEPTERSFPLPANLREA